MLDINSSFGRDGKPLRHIVQHINGRYRYRVESSQSQDKVILFKKYSLISFSVYL